MSHLLERVGQSIQTRGLARRGERILVAVSGGVDSMALLYLLDALAPKHRWRLAVAHFNHRLRGRSGDADERLVRQTAEKLGWPFVSARADVRRFARAHKLSLEMAARHARHHFLARAAVRHNIRSIALAHHADDQLELFFLRLFRGSGGEGLAGMKWTAPSPANDRGSALQRPESPLPSKRPAQGGRKLQTRLIRPLLDVSKADLEKFARENKIPFREDASNRDRDIQRNRIRHELLPLLRRKYQPALDRTIFRVMDLAGAESEFAGGVAAEWLAKRRETLSGGEASLPASRKERKNAGVNAVREDARPAGRSFSKAPERTAFAALPVAIQRRCVQIQLLRWSVAGDFDLVERLRTAPGRAVNVSPQSSVVLTAQGQLRLQRSSPGRKSGFRRPSAHDHLKTEIRNRKGEIDFGGLRIQWRIDSGRPRIPPKPRTGHEWFDADAVGSRILLRHWRAGDQFQPIGMSAPVKLQDLFTNRKIPREQRHELVVVTTGGGELVWVEKLRMSERFKLSNRTIRRLHWRWKRL